MTSLSPCNARRPRRRLACVAAVILGILGWASPAMADTYYYRDKTGPRVLSVGAGEFELEYLTYNYDGLDDYIQQMDVYIVVGGQSHLLFTHRGDHGDNHTMFYNNGYGMVTAVGQGISAQSVSTYGSGDLRYQVLRFTLPECYWGRFSLRVEGTFCYERNDSSPLQFAYSLPEYSLGSPRFTNSPTISEIKYLSDEVRFRVKDVPRVEYATTNLTFFMDDEEIGTYRVANGSQTGTVNVLHDVKPASFDGSKSHRFKAVSEVSCSGNASQATASLTRGPYAAATRLNAEFNPVKRAVTVTWETDNACDDQITGVSVQRRPYGSDSWTEIGPAPAGATRLVDSDVSATGLKAGERYEYRVMPYPSSYAEAAPVFSGWTVYDTYDITLKPELDINLAAARELHGATLTWDIPHSSEFAGCNIAVWRTSASGSEKTKLADVAYGAQGDGSYTDTGITGVYKYYIELDAQATWYGRSFTSPAVQVQTIESAAVRELRVSKGQYAGVVHLEWDVDNVTPVSGATPERTTYTLWRRSLEAPDAEFSRIYTLSTNDEYIIYEDKNVLPGIYYEYRLDALAKANDEDATEVLSSTTGVGFSMSSGKITGTVSYGSGTAVAGVDVVATPSSAGADMTASRCLDFSGCGEARIACSADKLNTLFNNAKGFTMQMWVNPAAADEEGAAYVLANIGDSWVLRLRREADGTFTLLHSLMQEGVATESADILAGIPAQTYSHLTLGCRDGKFTALLHTPGEAGEMAVLSGEATVQGSGQATASTDFCLGGSYKGLIDDFRLWSRALTADEAAANYNCSLTGAESSLEIYWRFDEGLDKMFFDSSRKGTILNGNHGTLTAGVVSSTLVPPARYLAYRAVTDADGNYMIDGIPFAGEGTSYSIVPAMGIHEFKPNKLLRYVGANSLVHNATDFTDVSSFPVSGTVYYADTTYPVADCNFYVDGVIASREGKMITSGADGSFTIDVPIGDHHIEVRKEGHTFVSGGRYPADPENVGTKLTFDREVTGLTFEDATLVNFAGRVTGGAIEGAKPLGFGQSVNTVGQARLSLVPQDDRHRLNVIRQVSGTSVEYVTNPATLPCEAVQPTLGAIDSNAWRGAGDEDRTRIFIDTDPATGEFSALLPPLRYVVESVQVIKTGTTVAEGAAVDLSNPLVTLADSIVADGVKHRYSYQKGVRFTHRTAPTLVVADKYAEPGAFGIKECDGQDEFGEFHVGDVYTVAADGTVSYPYGHPVFVTGDPYTFTIRGFEEYVNSDRDDADPLVYRVPLKDVEITVSNELSAIQEVYYQGDDAGKLGDSAKQTVRLDDAGAALYNWRGGLPNINAPYTRNISMSYTIDGKTYTWGGADMECFLFGELPTGANFVTEGPDHVDMVLRDPPGSLSKMEWTKGSTTATTTLKGSSSTFNDQTTTTTRFGLNTKVGAGVGLMKIEESEAKADVITGVHVVRESNSSTTMSRTVTATRTIATSDSPEFVGSMGDIYVGASTNLTFGNARQIDFHREGADGTPQVSRRDVVTTGLSFGTNFTYSQFFVENILLPNFEKLIESKLTYADPATIEAYTHTGSETVYLTPLRKGDRGFGSANDDKDIWGAQATNKMAGPSYWMFAPDDDKFHTDSIAWLNQQIVNWKKIMASNEEDKVRAYHLDKGRHFIHNVSFDGGATVTYTEQNDSTSGVQHEATSGFYGVFGGKSGYTWNKVGIVVETSNEAGSGSQTTEGTETTETASFAYTLAEDSWDALTVDVMKSPQKWSPLFHTRAGQTSVPYEGEERTKYYSPGVYTLHEATMQMEVPRISVENPVATDIPVGGSATYRLQLSNESECDYDFYFLLLVDDESNPDGAALKLDGQPLTNGRLIKVPAGEVLGKTLQLSQTQPGVLDYENIRLVLASEKQNDPTSPMAVIADTCAISAHFVPSSSPVALKVSSRVVNSVTGTLLPVTFDGYDSGYTGLKAFRVQYRQAGAPAWTLEREYVLSEELLDGNNELLPDGGAVALDIETGDWPDGTYLLRVLSVSAYGSQEVTCASDEIEIAKDVARPAPIGVPTPSNGILGPGDELSVTFNEDLRTGYITAADNISVRGRLNDAPVSHDGVFRSNGGAGAVTNAAIDLGGRSFSMGFWMKWDGEGSLLRHGTANNSLDLSVLADGRLALSAGDASFTSEASLPAGRWCYVNMAYNASAGTATVDAACDAATISLLDRVAVGPYSGNGVLAVGKGLNGSVHELTLWNGVRDFATAQSEINTLKSPATEGLAGYWRLDEGHGSEGADLARNRHMTLPDANSWALASDNVGAALDGTDYVEIDISQAVTAPAQDYLLELWVRAAGQTGAEQAVFSLSDGSLALLAGDGSLRLTAAGADYPVAASLADGGWHHVALNVLRGSSGTATLYIDGKAVAQQSASAFPPVEASRLLLGAAPAADEGSLTAFLTGAVDEVRLWHATKGAEAIRARMYSKQPSGEPGLAAYYPFESRSLDSYGQAVTTPDLADRSADSASAEARVLRRGAETSSLVADWSTLSAPAVKDVAELQNVSFSFTASDRKILVSIDEDPARVEGCTLEVNVHSVQDAHGNFSRPVEWSAYVSRNSLAWEESARSVTMDVTGEASFAVNIVNSGSATRQWSLSGLPLWLEADRESGTLSPLSSRPVTFTVVPGTAVGRYECTVALCGDDGLRSTLAVSLSVRAQRPDWSVDPSAYEHTMNAVAQLKVDGVFSEDTDDLVAAFVDGECRGLAAPAYFRRYDAYYLMLTVYGNGADAGKEVSFKVFDASAGIVLPEVTPSQAVAFVPDMMTGSIAAPLLLEAVDSREQLQALSAGWNWMSLYVAPYDSSTGTVLAAAADDGNVVKSKVRSAMYAGDAWTGDLLTMAPGEMYKVKTAAPALLQLRGNAIDNAAHPIDVAHGWNWIGYDNNFHLSLDEALAGLDPEDGDMIKGRDAFAIYMGYEWVGSLTMLSPGCGYIYKSEAAAAKSFTYPSAPSGSAQRAPARAYDEPLVYTPCDSHKYQGNMTVVAQVRDADNQPVPCEVAVFDPSGECRAANRSLGDDDLLFLTVQGETYGETLSFRIVYRDEAGKVVDVPAKQTVAYANDGVVGSPSDPFILTPDITAGVSDAGDGSGRGEEVWIDMLGRRIKNPDTGVYIRIDPSGARDIELRR